MVWPPRAAAWLGVLGLALSAGCAAATPEPVATQAAPVGATATPDPSTIIWAVPAPPRSLDPARLAADAVAEQITAQVYDRLVGFRPGTAQLAPGIAARWEADLRANTFTFTLRPGLRFHDGTVLDEQAVVWNFDRWMNPKHPQHLGKFPAWQGLFGGFIGQEDSQGQAAWLVESVEAIGPLQVRFKLRAPFTPFLYHLAMLPFGLASPKAVAAQGEAYGSDGSHLPVGSGPYRVVAWEPDGTIRLRPFAGYWGTPPVNPGVDFVVMPDALARADAVAAGAVHGTDLGPTPPVSATLATPGVSVVARPARSTAWLMLNLGRPPLDNARVRQAIALAIDRAKLATERFGPQGEPAAQLVPEGFLGHNPEIVPVAADPEAARRMLAEEDADENFRLNIWVPAEPRPYLPDPEGTAGAIAEMLQAIGINASVRTQAPRQFLRDRENGRFTAWLVGWEAQSADPDNFWFWHFGVPSRIVAEGNYTNPDLAIALRDAQRILDSEERAEVYHRAAVTIDRDTARIFLAHVRPVILMSTRLHGFEPSPLGADGFAEAALDPLPLGATAAPLATFRAPQGEPGTPADGTAPPAADGTEPPAAGGTGPTPAGGTVPPPETAPASP